MSAFLHPAPLSACRFPTHVAASPASLFPKCPAILEQHRTIRRYRTPRPPAPGNVRMNSEQPSSGNHSVSDDQVGNVSAAAPSPEEKNPNHPPGFILWGPPGCGKTSICESLSRTHGLVHVSTGALLRAHVLYDTDYGVKARPFLLRSSTVPDDVIIPIVLERLRQRDVSERGFLLDGFPRNPRQHAALASHGFTCDLVIMLNAPRDTLGRRIRHRRLDPETELLYNLKLRPPESQEVLERLIVLDKDRADNAAELFASYGRATNETFHLVAPNSVRVDADRPFDDVLESVVDVLSSHDVNPLKRSPSKRTAPPIIAPPELVGRASAVREASFSDESPLKVRASMVAALRGRRRDPDDNNQQEGDQPHHVKSPISLIRCDGYICERESVEESHIAFRGAATEQVMLMWNRKPRTALLLVKKDPELMSSVVQAARHLMEEEGLAVIVENRVQTQALANGLFLETFSSSESLHERVDFVVCLGGDGLILHASTLFRTAVPPVISFNLGSLGFLTPFHFEDFRAEIRALLNGFCNLSLRMRLQCEVVSSGKARKEFQVLNEVVVDRGASPYLSNLDCFCDGKYITTVQADGVIMSTATGSTAYSMSAGGSMVHPSVPAILFTPICPHSLSFRPIVFPDSASLRIEIAEDSRSHAWASFDGKSRQQLKRGDGLVVQMNLFPVPTVNKTDHTGDWFQSLDRAFNFNSRAGQKPLSKRPRTIQSAGATDDIDNDEKEIGKIGNGEHDDDSFLMDDLDKLSISSIDSVDDPKMENGSSRNSSQGSDASKDGNGEDGHVDQVAEGEGEQRVNH